MAKRLTLTIIPLLIVTGLSFAGISELEERDRFCTSCHLAPETTYYERAVAASNLKDPYEVADLASFHYWDTRQAESRFRCVDCHRGSQSLADRTSVFVLALKDTGTWVAGEADQTVEKGSVTNVHPQHQTWLGPQQFNRQPELLNDGCLSCHQDALTLVGFENHFHNRLPEARLAYEMTGELYYPDSWSGPAGTAPLLQTDETILSCLDCHRAHVGGFESEFFLDVEQVVLPACVQCHLEAGQGPLDLVQ